MTKQTNFRQISRQRFVGGTMVVFLLVLRVLPDRFERRVPAIGQPLRLAVSAGVGIFVVLMGIAAPAFATAKAGIADLATGGAGGDCRLRHASMAEKLSQTIADPSVNAEATALAIRTSFCPCCGTQIGASSGFQAVGVAA